MTEDVRPTAKPKPPRIPIWVTEKELDLIAAKFQGFQGGLAEALSAARTEARKARTQHNRALRAYRNERKERGEEEPMWHGDREYLQLQHELDWTPERYGGRK